MSQSTPTFHRLLILFIALLGFALSSGTFIILQQQETETIVERFRLQVNEVSALLERELALHLEALHGLESLFIGSDHVTATEFQRATNRILSRHTDIQALEWIPRVLHSERDQVIRKIRANYPNFEITERTSQGVMAPALQRPEYFPVLYVEPYPGNEDALGFDLASDPVRRQALISSMTSGELQVTAPITLIQGQTKRPGFLAFQPVFQRGRALSLSRSERLMGFVLGVYRISDILADAIADRPLSGIRLELVDITDANKPLRLHFTQGESTELIGGYPYQHHLRNVGGRHWLLRAQPTERYMTERHSVLPAVLMIAGLLVTTLLCLVLYFIVNRTAMVEILVRQRTDQLNRLNKHLEILSVTDSLTSMKNKRYFNEALEREWNRARRDKLPLAVIMIDIDHFKLFNDNYGHIAGDTCLQSVALGLQGILNRPADLIARFGGEEFAVILPNTDTGALEVAQRCLNAVRELQIPHKYNKVADSVTISCGVSYLTPGQDTAANRDQLLNCADKALYQAKAYGRNRVESSTLSECQSP